MADEAETPQDEEVLELTEEASDTPNEETQPEATDEDGDEVVVGFADEQPEEEPEPENSTVRKMREALREKERELKELRAKVDPPKAKRELPPEPTLESCDYDEDVLKAETRKWDKIKAEIEADEAEAEREKEARTAVWEARKQRYVEGKVKIGVDLTDAEATVDQALGQTRSPVLLLAQDPAALALALSRSPAKLKELSEAKDDFELAYMVGKLEGQVTVQRRKKAPAIDRAVGGTASTTLLSTDAQLEKLEKEADRTGDRSKVIEYKRKLRRAE